MKFLIESRVPKLNKTSQHKQCTFRRVCSDALDEKINIISSISKSNKHTDLVHKRQCGIRKISLVSAHSNKKHHEYKEFFQNFIIEEFKRCFPEKNDSQLILNDDKINQFDRHIRLSNSEQTEPIQNEMIPLDHKIIVLSQNCGNPSIVSQGSGEGSESSMSEMLLDAQNQDKNSMNYYNRIVGHLNQKAMVFTSVMPQFEYSQFCLIVKQNMHELFQEKVKNIFKSFTKKLLIQNGQVSQDVRISVNKNWEFENSPRNYQYDSNCLNLNNLIADNKIEDELDSPKGKSSTSQSKFHNLKKSFMHALILLFQSDVLECLNLSNLDISHLICLINRMRVISTKSKGSKGQKYEYYSHNHYTTLMLMLNEKSLQMIQSKDHDIEMHQYIFQENLKLAASPFDPSSIRCNYYKNLIFEIINNALSIIVKENEQIEETKCEQKSLARFDYILRVKAGIMKLNQGQQINRF